MGLITGITLPSNGDRIKAENYNTPIQAIIAAINGGLDSTNITAGSLPWEVMASFTNKIPSTAMQDSGSLEKFRDETNASLVASGCVWSITSGLTGAMTSGVIYVTSGLRTAVSAVTSKVFTAAKDTYVDISPAGVVTYSEVANGATAPAITTDYIRIALVITNGSAITAIHKLARESYLAMEEIGRTTIGLASNTISVTALPNRKFMLVVVDVVDTGGTIDVWLRFNGDTGSNYAFTRSVSGAAESSSTSAAAIVLVGTLGSPSRTDVFIRNINTQEKLTYCSSAARGTAGAGNLPSRVEGVGKWANTADAINRIDIVNGTGSGTFAAGSEVRVFGWN